MSEDAIHEEEPVEDFDEDFDEDEEEEDDDDLQFDHLEEAGGQAGARRVLSKTALVLKLTTMHQLNNKALVRPIAELLAAVATESGGGVPLSLQMVGSNFFLSQEVVKLDYSSYESAQALRGIMKRLQVSEITIRPGLTEQTLRDFLASFQAHYTSQEPWLLKGQRFEHFSLRLVEGEAGGGGGDVDPREALLQNYASLALSIRDALQALKASRSPRMAFLRRGVQTLADASIGHEPLLVALTSFRRDDPEEHLPFHLAAVASHVILMCRRLELSRKDMSEAGVGAVLHHVGRSLLLEPEGEPPSQVELRRASMLQICGRGLTPRHLAYASVSFEHEEPATSKPKPSMLSRMIAVPCAFDLLTRPMPPQRGVLPDQAMRIILDHSGDQFDPVVVSLFTRTVGLLPIGSLVKLSTGDTAVVMDVAPEPADYALPRVKVIRTEQGPADYVLDLKETHGEISIAECMDAQDEDINAPSFLFA